MTSIRTNLWRSVAAAGLFALSAGAVTFGEPDGTRHPWVGTLLFQAADGYLYSCTGTLLSPTVMVTAAHCTVDGGQKNIRTWVKFEPVIAFAGRENYGSLLEYLNDKKNGWITADVVPHPNYTGSYPNSYDIGVVLLSRRAPVTSFGALPPKHFLDGVKDASENFFTVVGYGMQGYIKPFYGDEYSRYLGNVRLVELNGTFNGDQMSAKFSNNPGNTAGGSCYGDSGGPVFYSNTNMVVAVVSWGITPCIGVDYQFRTDTAVAQDFVRKFLK